MRSRISVIAQYVVTLCGLASAVILGERLFGIGWVVFWPALVFAFLLTWTHALAVPGWPRKLAIRASLLITASLVYALVYVLAYFLYGHDTNVATVWALCLVVPCAILAAYLDARWNGEKKNRLKAS